VRKLLCLLLMLILPLQAFALQGGSHPDAHAYDLQHEMAHQHGVSHHHDDSGNVHYDDSTESKQHAADSVCCHHFASIASSNLFISFDAPSEAVNRTPATGVPPPFLERPQRPPSALG
jgi:hypothetical protein